VVAIKFDLARSTARKGIDGGRLLEQALALEHQRQAAGDFARERQMALILLG